MIWSQKKHLQTTIHVEGIRCNHCESSIKMALGRVLGVKRVKIHKRQRVVIEFKTANQIKYSKLTTAIETAGYKVISTTDI